MPSRNSKHMNGIHACPIAQFHSYFRKVRLYFRKVQALTKRSIPIGKYYYYFSASALLLLGFDFAKIATSSPIPILDLVQRTYYKIYLAKVSTSYTKDLPSFVVHPPIFPPSHGGRRRRYRQRRRPFKCTHLRAVVKSQRRRPTNKA